MEKETQYTAMRSIILIHSIEASFEIQSLSLHTIFSGTLVMESLERLDLLTIYLVACCLLSVLRGIVPLMGGSLQNYQK
ncbi:hypothetical protein T12_3077 [Trichinella patagoniensis]|uniref:Uncharacterized protein n=1 Tax=Trichinella patagoniensis TaxID=990121 RepID=A0A0V1A4N4_9BILA|nr:hypothetical protein T12_3077 [Trichinella patagoniensis]